MSLDHRAVADLAAAELSQLSGVERIYLYGSVARGTQRPQSDVDLALIVDDICRSFALSLEGEPMEHAIAAAQLCDRFVREHGVRVHAVTYWASERWRDTALPPREGVSTRIFDDAIELYRDPYC